jgi:hypothetical protein
MTQYGSIYSYSTWAWKVKRAFNFCHALLPHISDLNGNDIYVRLSFYKGVDILAKKGLATFVLATTLLGLTACNANDNTVNERRGNLSANNLRYNNNSGLDISNVSNQDLRVSSRAIRNVEKLREVADAHVIVRGNDAYVAVRLNNNTNQQGNVNGKNTGLSGSGNTVGTTGFRGNGDASGSAGFDTGNNNHNMTGYTSSGNNGVPAHISGNRYQAGTTGFTDNNYDRSTVNNTNNVGTSGTNPGMNGMSGNNTNPGTTGMGGPTDTGDTNYKKASTPLEKRIAGRVRAADHSIDNVYISYDSTFYRQMTNYTNDIRNGRNANGLWDNFTNDVGRFFR